MVRCSNFHEFHGCLLSTKIKHKNITAQGIKISTESLKNIKPRILYALSIHKILKP